MIKKSFFAALACAYSSGFFQSMPRMGDGDVELELSYSNQDDIPAGFDSLYTEKDGKFVLSRVKGVDALSASVQKLEKSLSHERNDHKATKAKYASLSGLDIDELLRRNASYEELEIRANSNTLDDAKLNSLVEARLKQKLVPIERERDDWKAKATTYEQTASELSAKEKQRKINDAVRKAARTEKVIDSAVEDIELIASNLFELTEDGNVVARDGVGIAPGIDPVMWLQDQRERKPHWFPGNVGGGSGGGNGAGGSSNPYSHDNWNMTEQSKLYRENPEKAKRMASMYGVNPLNPVRPVKK